MHKWNYTGLTPNVIKSIQCRFHAATNLKTPPGVVMMSDSLHGVVVSGPWAPSQLRPNHQPSSEGSVESPAISSPRGGCTVPTIVNLFKILKACPLVHSALHTSIITINAVNIASSHKLPLNKLTPLLKWTLENFSVGKCRNQNYKQSIRLAYLQNNNYIQYKWLILSPCKPVFNVTTHLGLRNTSCKQTSMETTNIYLQSA